MKTPFPGMDPYLEHPALWPSVHTRLMVALANQLGPKVRPRYVASVEDRVFIEGPMSSASPMSGSRRCVQKVAVRCSPPARNRDSADRGSGELEVHEHYIAILDRYRDLKVVTDHRSRESQQQSGGGGARTRTWPSSAKSGAVNATWSRSTSCAEAVMS